MPKIRQAKHNFSAGEISPILYGRGDYAKYENALRVQRNFITTRRGTMTRRPGTRFIGWQGKGSSDNSQTDRQARLIEFKASADNQYVLEFGHLYIRFYRNDTSNLPVQLTKTENIAAVNTATEQFSIAGDFTDQIFVNDWITTRNYPTGASPDITYKVSAISYSAPNTVITVEGNLTDATVAGAIEFPTTIASPYTASQLSEIKAEAQSADVLYICHPDVPPRTLTRSTGADTAPGNWVLALFAFRDGPYNDINTTTTTVTTSANTGTVTITASSAIFDSDEASSGNDARQIRIMFNNAWGWGRISAVGGGGTTATVVIVNDFDSDNSSQTTTDWRLGAWYNTGSTGNWPHCAQRHQDRLWFGATDAAPERLWGSVVGRYNVFRPSQLTPFEGENQVIVLPDNAMTVNPSGNQLTHVYWLLSEHNGLLVFTSTGLQILRAGTSQYAPLVPDDFAISQHAVTSAHATVRPIQTPDAILFFQNSGRVLNETAFRFENDRFVVREASLLADQLFDKNSQATNMAYQETPHSTLWITKGGGLLVGLTYSPKEQIIAWHRHPPGGALSGGTPNVESVACIRNNAEDQVWIIVKRTIDGQTERFIEVIMREFRTDSGDTISDAIYMDASLSYSGSATTSVTNLYHLEGQTVAVFADGTQRNDATVSGGAITISGAAATKIHVGLENTTEARTMPLFLGDEFAGSRMRIGRAQLRFFESLSGSATQRGDQSAADTFETMDLVGTIEDGSTTFSGVYEMYPPNGWATWSECDFHIKAGDVHPMTLLEAIFDVDVGG